jgi:hypothetical protein
MLEMHLGEVRFEQMGGGVTESRALIERHAVWRYSWSWKEVLLCIAYHH